MPPAPKPSSVKTNLITKAKASGDVTVEVTKVQAIKAKAQGPGEVSGPAVAVTVSISNDGKKPFDLTYLSVNLEDSKGNPGSGMTAEPADWISGEVAPGKSKTGVYVFSVPKSTRNPVKVTVSVKPDMPTLVFEGKV